MKIHFVYLKTPNFSTFHYIYIHISKDAIVTDFLLKDVGLENAFVILENYFFRKKYITKIAIKSGNMLYKGNFSAPKFFWPLKYNILVLFGGPKGGGSSSRSLVRWGGC